MATRRYETAEQREARLVRHRAANRAYEERHPHKQRDWLASKTPDELAEYKRKRHDAYVARKARDPEAYRAKARESANRRRAANLDAARAYGRQKYAEDPERYRAYAKAYTDSHPEQARDRQYQRYYGVTLAAYQAMFAAQGGVCAICGRPETMTIRGKLKELSVDHDHATGATRGLLCSACNRALGFFKDDVALLRSAADYLVRHEVND